MLQIVSVALVAAESPLGVGDEGGEVVMLETVLMVPVDVEILVIKGDGNREVAMLMLVVSGASWGDLSLRSNLISCCHHAGNSNLVLVIS